MKQGVWAVVIMLMSLLTSVEAAVTGNRTALVIGNAKYAMMPLENPVNDAIAMTAVLQEAGFKVISALDADLDAMQDAMLQFTSSLNQDSTALVYYAGHGIQSNGRNYLIPVDAKLKSERALRFESMLLNDILEELDLSGARTKLVILDACRNNPFERSTRGGGRGLAAVDAAQGTLIAYATAPGATAADGVGDNGLYTESLIKAIRQPGLKVEEVFKQTRINVASASGGDQVPWESSSLTGELVFIQGDVNVNNSISRSDPEIIFWQSIENSDEPRMFKAYLDQYPGGRFRSIADLKYSLLSESAEMSSKQLATATVQPAVSPTEARASGPAELCKDLSGIWGNQATGNAACVARKLELTRLDGNKYKLYGKACGVSSLKATGELVGSKFLVKWKQSPCTGTTEFVLDSQCKYARGPIKVNPSFLCKNVVSDGILTRLGTD